MKRILEALVAVVALGVLAHARPASACGAQQKTTSAKVEEKAQPQKLTDSKQTPKDATATAKKSERGAQAKNDAGQARPQQR